MQALQYRDDPFSAIGNNSQRCHMCLRTDPLLNVLERLSQPGTLFTFFLVPFQVPLRPMATFGWFGVLYDCSGVRRLIIVEAGSKRVQGIVSLSDVFRFLLGIWVVAMKDTLQCYSSCMPGPLPRAMEILKAHKLILGFARVVEKSRGWLTYAAFCSGRHLITEKDHLMRGFMYFFRFNSAHCIGSLISLVLDRSPSSCGDAFFGFIESKRASFLGV